MAGKETRGAAAADADLFRGRTWILTPDERRRTATLLPRSNSAVAASASARACSRSMPTSTTASCRSPRTCAQLASTALAATVADKLGAPPRLKAAGPGLEDMTRLAMGSYEIWRDILATNSDHIERALSLYIQKLEHMRENLRTRQLQEEFERGAALAARLRAHEVTRGDNSLRRHTRSPLRCVELGYTYP